jgi:hypothetical protein
MFSVYCYKIVDNFFALNVKDNKKSVIFAPFDEKKLSGTIRVGNYLLL